MKKLFISALIVSFSFCLFSQVKKKPDFNKAYWGMSKGEVKNLEIAIPISEEQDKLLYEDKLFGIKCYCSYFFSKNRLIEGSYTFHILPDKDISPSVCLKDYKLLFSVLIEKYGEPKKFTDKWKKGASTKYGNTPKDVDKAIINNDLILSFYWKKPGSLISLNVGSYENVVPTMIIYSHPDYVKMNWK